MKKLLVSGIVLTGVLTIWGCGKVEPPAQPLESPKTTEAPKVEIPVSLTDTAKTAETVKPPVMPHVITDAEVGTKAVCPVMGVEVIVGKNTLAAEYKGKVYYFCCGGCPEEFKNNPDKYVK